MEFETIVRDETINVQINPDKGQFIVGDKQADDYSYTQANGRKLLRIGRKLYKVDDVTFDGSAVSFTLNGKWCNVDVRDEQDLLLEKMGFKTSANVKEGQLKAPMPGKILEILVQEGDQVEQGQAVAILEAMKMENELKAPVAGVIEQIAATTNDSLEKNATILVITARG